MIYSCYNQHLLENTYHIERTYSIDWWKVDIDRKHSMSRKTS